MRALRLLGAPVAVILAVGLGMVAPGLGEAQTNAVSGSNLAASTPRKVLHIALEGAESTLDPIKSSDTYSAVLSSHIFESLFEYDKLARPVKVKPMLAEAMPESSNGYRDWTIRLKRGIYFADDPAFKGQRREVTAQDVVYTVLRVADPSNKSPLWGPLEQLKIRGLAEHRKRLIDAKLPFNYDTPVEGLRALDRYTVQIRLHEPSPRFVYGFSRPSEYGVVAREVVEHYGENIAQHPVGTGPFRLKQWRRSSLIVLERNPHYREVLYDAQPASDDTEGQAILAKLRGKRLPLVDEVRVSVIEETQPRWLSFLNHELDALVGPTGQVPGEFAPSALPNGKVAPHLAKRGIQAKAQVVTDVTMLFFNMEDPVVGGNAPDKVALRRAISLATDVDREIRIVRRGQAIPAQSPIPPNVVGYDAAYKSEMAEYNPAKAKALLDMYGWVDRDGDGWRETPEGRPLELVRASQPEQIYRQFNELFEKDMRAIGIRVRFDIGKWGEHYKQAKAGKLQIWMLGNTNTSPDGLAVLIYMHGPQAGTQNLARFKHEGFDAAFDRLQQLPDGPEREALFLEAKRIAAAYMPYKFYTHRIRTDMWHPWVIGYRRPVFYQEFWHMIDVDVAMRDKVLGR